MITRSVRAGVLAFGLGLAALTIPQLLDTAAAETAGSAVTPAASAPDTMEPARARAATRTTPAVRAARVRTAAAAAPAAETPVPTANTWSALPARPRYRSPESPAAAAPRPSAQRLGTVLGTYVYFYNRTDQTLAIVQVPKGGPNDPEADPRFLAPGEKSDFYGDNNGGGNMDVRLRIYSAVADDSAVWRKDQMREIIAATNRAIGKPYARVMFDPYPDGFRSYYNRYRNKDLDVGQNWFADYDLTGPIQSGQTGTFIVRLSDRKGEFKVFQIEVFKIPQGPTQDYPLGSGGDA